MKLPRVEYRKVESLGRADLGAVGALAGAESRKGQVAQQTANMFADLSANYIQRKENAEYNDQVASMQVEMSEWQGKYTAKDFYTADELGNISEEAVPRMDITTDDLGNEIQTSRNFIPAHEVYPHMLKQKLDAITMEKSEKISNPLMRQEFLRKAGVNSADMMMKASIAAENAQEAYMLKLGIDKASDAAEGGDIAAAQFYIDELETDELTKKGLIEKAEVMAEGYHVNQAIRSTNPETVMAMRALLDDENYSGNLSEAQRQGAIRDLNGQLVELDSERTAEMAKQHEVAYSDANAAIDSGDFTNLEIEEGFARYKENENDPTGWDGAERTALRGRLTAFNNRNRDFNNRAEAGADLLNGGADPYDADHQKNIDAYVEKNQITDLRKLEDIVMKTSIMPQVVENHLNSNAANGEPAEATKALEMYGRLVDSDAYKVREMGPEAKEIFSDAHILNRGGVNPVRALEIARENARLAPELKEQRKINYKALEADDKNPKALQEFMEDDGTRHGFEVAWYTSDIQATDEMTAQFNNMVSVHYERTGDLARAQSMAWSSIQETWGPTGVGADLKGTEIVHPESRPQQYAPERLMNVTTAVANNRLGAFSEAHGFDVENVMVISDPITARDGSWAIMVIDPETNLPNFQINSATGQVLRWYGNRWGKAGVQYGYDQSVAEAVAEREQVKASKTKTRGYIGTQ